MRRISATQIGSFALILAVAVALGFWITWAALDRAPLGDFRGVALVVIAVGLTYALTIALYRLFLISIPLRVGELQPGSTAEFAAQVNSLFYLMVFNSLIRTHFLPIPLMRWVYIALGAKLGQNTYSAGALLDPPLTWIGSNSIVGHDAVIFAHVIEGSRFALYTVRIGNNVTIGAHAVVMPDVEIGDGAIVSVGAVVVKGTHIGTGEIWGGVPARCIGRCPVETLSERDLARS